MKFISGVGIIASHQHSILLVVVVGHSFNSDQTDRQNVYPDLIYENFFTGNYGTPR
jgi:hypothetical protein